MLMTATVRTVPAADAAGPPAQLARNLDPTPLDATVASDPRPHPHPPHATARVVRLLALVGPRRLHAPNRSRRLVGRTESHLLRTGRRYAGSPVRRSVRPFPRGRARGRSRSHAGRSARLVRRAGCHLLA